MSSQLLFKEALQHNFVSVSLLRSGISLKAPVCFQLEIFFQQQTDFCTPPFRYPQAKESTHKIRGRYDFIEMFCGSNVDQELLPVKSFYFFFYSAFGSLFPLMGVYFKQMGMNPTQCGLLVGSRPFVEFLSAPFWGSYADRLKKGKVLLLASIGCWIFFTLPIGFIQPAPTSCLEMKNDTYFELRTPRVPRRMKREALDESYNNYAAQLEESFSNVKGGLDTYTRVTRAAKPPSVTGQSPVSVEYANNYDPKKNKGWVSPEYSSIVYKIEVVCHFVT